jgi:hypothetical protein
MHKKLSKTTTQRGFLQNKNKTQVWLSLGRFAYFVTAPRATNTVHLVFYQTIRLIAKPKFWNVGILLAELVEASCQIIVFQINFAYKNEMQTKGGPKVRKFY